MPAMTGFGGSITFAQPPNVALTNLVLQDSGDHKTFTVKAVDAAKRYWDKSVAFTFQTSPDGSTWSNATPATVQYVSGSITFAAAVTGATPGARVATGAYLPYSIASDCKDWQITPQVDMLESTVLGSRAKTYVPALLGSDIKISKFYTDGTFSALILTTPPPLLIVSLYTGRNAGERWECYARLKQLDTKQAVNALVENDLALTADGPVYYVAS